MAQSKKVVGIFAKKDPFVCKNEWSGTVYKVRKAIENAGYEVKWIPYRPNKLKWTALNLWTRLTHGRHAKVRQLKSYARLCAASVDPKSLEDCDYYFFPGGAEMIPYLDLKKPTIYLVDATFRLLSGYYYLHNDAWCNRQGEERARDTYKACDMIISSSQWAKDSLVNDYDVSESKVQVIPFGANLDDNDVVFDHKSWSDGSELHLLFSGVEWERKGGDIAVATVKALRDRGINATLTIVGIKELPLKYKGLDYVTNLGFLHKSNPDEYRQYLNAYKDSHIFLLPSKAECSAIVLCEASGMGTPIVTFDTGGLADYVENGVNGIRMPIESTPEDFADAIVNMMPHLSQLSQGGREMYEQKLNWKHWTDEFVELMKTMH